MNTAVYGNLALKPNDQKPAFTLVSGGKKPVIVAARRQLAAPAVYARTKPRPPRRLSTIFSVACVAAILCAALAAACGDAFIRTSSQSAAISQAVQTEIRVQPGDTLWNIAEEHSIENVGIEETMALIRDWNDMPNSMLQAGTKLIVPLAD